MMHLDYNNSFYYTYNSLKKKPIINNENRYLQTF